MKTLIMFSLNKRYRNRMTVIMNILVFVVIGLLMHADYIVGNNSNDRTICIDSSLMKYHERFLSLNDEEHAYQISDDGNIILHYDGTWKLYSEKKIDDKTVEMVRKDITGILSSEYYDSADPKLKEYIDEYNNIQLTNVYQSEEQGEDNPVWALLSVIYFIILSYGNLVANEVVYEKATNTLPIILTSVDEKDHFYAKIITAYLSVMIQAAIVLVELTVWIFIRYAEDKMKGIVALASSYLNGYDSAEMIMLPMDKIFMISLFVIIGIVTVQTVMLIFFSGFSNSDDVGSYQGPMYIVMVICYYYLLIKGNTELFTSIPSVALSYLPVFSMLFMPCRLAVSSVGVFEKVASLLISMGFFMFIIKMGLPVYKKNLSEGKTKRKIALLK
ncbi:MAG: hypothetical protein IJ115_03910 [Erysipelotrichaceae bacterium]|nr:hypothetical protein [Erysipelotrichaceae bacterium]